MERIYENDFEVKEFEEHKDFLKFLKKMEANSEWLDFYINQIMAVGIPNMPICFMELCSDIDVHHNGFKVRVGNIDFTSPNAEDCLTKGNGLFLVLPGYNKMVPVPCGHTAFSSICQRTGLSCSSMERFKTKTNAHVWPIDERAKVLTRCMELYSGSCKILVRGGMVHAMLSDNYAILEQDQLVNVVERQLAQDHPDYRFKRAQISAEYTFAEYELNDQFAEESLRLKLNSFGADISSLKVRVRFATSDVGQSKASCTVVYLLDGMRMPCSEGVYMAHKGDASIGLFQTRMNDLAQALKDSEDLIERLGNTDIKDVPGTLEKICEKYAFLGKRISDEIIRQARTRYPNGGTAIDVYLLICEIVDYSCKAADPAEYIDLNEQAAKLMKLPFEKIDAGEAWINLK